MNSSDDDNFNDLLQICLQKKMRSLLSLELADYLTAVWVSNGNNKNNYNTLRNRVLRGSDSLELQLL